MAAQSPGFAITRSASEYESVVVPRRPAPAPPPPFPGADIVAPPVVTVAALRSALERPPQDLPAAVLAGPEAWLRALGDPPRVDAVAVRLLWPRVSESFGAALARALAAAPGAAFVLAAPDEPHAAGTLLPVLDALLRSGRDATVLLRADALAALREVERDELLSALEGRSEPVVILDPALPAAALVDLLWLPPGLVARGEGAYRGSRRAFAVASAAALQADVPGRQWQEARDAVGAALDRLLARPVGTTEREAADLLAALPLPAFAASALKGPAELLREVTPVSFPLPPAIDDPGAVRRRLEATLARRREEIGDREARHHDEVAAWIQGGKLSLLGARATSGLVPALGERVRAQLAGSGLAAALGFLAAVRASLTALVPPALGPLRARLAELEQRRAALPAPPRAEAGTLGGLLGRKEPGGRTDALRALAEQARLAGEIVQVAEALALASAGEELVARALEAVAAAVDELERVRLSTGLVQAALDAGRAPGAVENEGAATARGAELLTRALGPAAIARWAASPQGLLDDLWSQARAPVSAAALLATLDRPGARLASALEALPAQVCHERLPRRLQPEPMALLVTPNEGLARRAAAELPFPARVALEPAAEAIRLLRVEAGLPAFALACGPLPRARAGEAWRALLEACFDAPDLGALGAAGAALARADALVTPANGEELAVLAGLAPALEALAKAGEVSDAETRVHYLEQSRRALDDFAAEAARSLVEPERGRAAAAVGRYRDELARALAGARGRADLRLELTTRRLGLSGAAVRIEVEVSSCGSVAAESVTVMLEPGERYRVLGEARVALGRLPPGSVSTASFQLRPPGPGVLPIRLSARWDDLAGKGHGAELDASLELGEVRAGFRRIESNPYIAGPPVRSESMFFGRSEVFGFVRDNLRGRHQNNVLLLHGNRRTGKSSLLCQLERGRHVEPFVPVYLDLQGLGRLTTASLFAALARKIARAVAGRGREAPEPPAREALEGDHGFELMNEFLDDIESSPTGAPPLLIMLDEFEILEDKAREGRVDGEIFGWLRAKMQHSDRLAFVLAGTHRLAELDPVLWQPLLSLCLYRHVSFLSEGEARELVTQPIAGELDFDDLALEAVLRLTGRHPYYVQLLCQILVGVMNERARSNVVTLEDIHEAASRLLEAGGGQFSYEWGAPRRDESRLLLAALAELADSAAVWVDLADAAQLAGLLATEADAGARELESRELAVGSGGSFRVHIDLFRQWLRRERPVSRARAEASR